MSARLLLIATTNRGKLAEIAPILQGVPFALRTLADFPGIDVPEENGRTFADNARAKARHYHAATGKLTVAEDSGLEIDALDGAPGVESARYAGADASYPEKFRLLYDALRASGGLGSRARFVCALALVDANGVLFETQGVVEGRIADEPRGSGGFGYDPIFFYPPFDATLAEVSDRKSAVSHRGQAFRSLRAFLNSPSAPGP
jgi:XTP/dITP diphosphohydrolase